MKYNDADTRTDSTARQASIPDEPAERKMEKVDSVPLDFDRRKRRQLASTVPLAVLLVLVLLRGRTTVEPLESVLQEYLFTIAVVVVVAFFIFSLFNWRCPSCNRYLGQRLSPKTCPHCGIDLVD